MDGKPYPIPKPWTDSSIGKVVVKTKQRDPRKKPDEVFQYVDVSAVSNASFKIMGAAPTLGSEAPSRARKEIRTDDVLFATFRPTLKRIALVPPKIDGAIASTGYCILRCDETKAHLGFFDSSQRNRIKDTFSRLRAERLEWIAVALQDAAADRFQGWDRDTKTYDKTRRVTLVCGNYVVVIALTGATSARFLTAYVADTPSTLAKLKTSPKWTP